MKEYTSQEEWLTDKADGLGLAFPNLPYWKDGNFGMTEHLGIHQYLAEKYSPKLAGTTPEERATISMLA
jgi:hypothetical protein